MNEAAWQPLAGASREDAAGSAERSSEGVVSLLEPLARVVGTTFVRAQP